MGSEDMGRHLVAPWAASTVKEKVLHAAPSHTSALRQAGSSNPLANASRRSAPWPRRASPLPRLVKSFVIPTESHKSRWSPATRSCASSAPRDLPHPSLRTCTSLSRRPSPCASTWRRTARTRIPSSVSFLSSPVSTVSHVTTSSPSALHATGVTSPPTLLPSLSKQKQNQWRTTQVFLICVANKKLKPSSFKKKKKKKKKSPKHKKKKKKKKKKS